MDNERLKRRVLVVDDDKIIRSYIQTLLASAFDGESEVFEAYDGVSALQLLEDEPVGILFTDMRMPRMDGLRLIASVRARWPWVRFVVLSNYDDFDYVRQSFLFGIVNYVLKYQINEELLIGLVREAQSALDDYFRQCEVREQMHRAEAYELCRQRGIQLEEALGAFRAPPFLTDQGKKPLLNVRIDCLPDQGAGGQAPRTLAETWALLFERETSGAFFPCVLPELPGTNNLRLCVIACTHLRNEAAAKMRVIELIKTFLDGAVRTERCIAVAAHESSLGFDAPLLMRLSAAVEMVYYAERSELLEAPTVSTELLPQTDVYPLFWDALLAGHVQEAKEIVRETADLLRRLRPAPSVARKMLSRFLHEMQSAGAHTARELPPALTNRLITHEAALIGLIESAPSEVEQTGYGDPALDELIRRILGNLSDPISLDEAARRVGFSRTHFCRIFRKATGESFNEFITRKRIEHACVLLKKPGAQLRSVSAMVGISDVRYFKKLFKQHMHMPVGEWMKAR